MAEQLAKDYSNYILHTNIAKEVGPICNSIDEMLTRLEEFESLLNIVKNESSISTKQHIPQISAYQSEFEHLCQRIDNLDKFLTMANNNLTILEQHVATAEQELGFNESGIKGFLKPLFGGRTKSDSDTASNLNADNIYIPPKIYDTSDYFPDSSNC